MKKLIIILVLALGLLVFASTKAYADNSDKYPPIIQKLVERFGLNEDEVKAVFDEAREEQHQQMQNRFEERLNQAVSEGEITEEQKQAILAKREEMQANREEFKDLSPEERREKMEAHQEEMKKWAEENGLELDSCPMFLGEGPRGGFGPKRFGE